MLQAFTAAPRALEAFLLKTKRRHLRGQCHNAFSPLPPSSSPAPAASPNPDAPAGLHNTARSASTALPLRFP